MNLTITGIGSRRTPQPILKEMESIARSLASHSHWFRSGHAEGADYAFEKGAGKQCLVYLPWIGFNMNLPLVGRSIVVGPDPNREKIVDRLHPNPDALTWSSRKLMERNVCQIIGIDGNLPSNYVVCWTRDGGPTGGTGLAIRLAEEYRIPVLNMFHEEWNSTPKVLNKIYDYLP